MAAAHPFGAFVGCRFKRIGCVRRIKVKFMYKVPEWTAPNQTTPNWITQSQTKACITKSCEVCAQVRYALYTGKSTLMFWDNLSVQASRVKKSKRVDTAREKLNDTFFWGGGGGGVQQHFCHAYRTPGC